MLKKHGINELVARTLISGEIAALDYDFISPENVKGSGAYILVNYEICGCL